MAYNAGLLALENEYENVCIIENREISDMECHRQLFVQDGIHFSSSGTVALVKILKTHINTKLGLKPYSAYGENTDNNYNKREFNAIQTPRHFPANQNQNQNNNHRMYQYQNNLPNTPRQNNNQYRNNNFKQRQTYNRFQHQNNHFDLKSALTNIIQNM